MTTHSVIKSALALYSGCTIRGASVRGGRVQFDISEDVDIQTLLASLETGELLVEPRAFFDAIGEVRKVVHAAKDGREFTQTTNIWLDTLKQSMREGQQTKGQNP